MCVDIQRLARFWTAALFCANLASCSGASALIEEQHPAHYILLVDASGSTASSRSKVQRYRELLLDQLLPKLFKGDIAAGIPPFAPQKDLISVIHFGLVPHGIRRPLDNLRHSDVLTSLIHPIQVAQPHASPSQISSWLLPASTYQYTLSTIALPLSVTAVAKTASRTIISHTYLIVTTDGLLNRDTTGTEIGLLKRWGDPVHSQKLLNTIENITREYAWDHRATRSLSQSTAPFLIKAYELVPRAWITQLQVLQSQGLVTDSTLKWSWSFQHGLEGLISMKVAPQGQTLISLRAATQSDYLLAMSPPEVLSNSIALRFRVHRIFATSVRLPVSIQAVIRSGDARLGSREVRCDQQIIVFGW